MLNYKAIEIFTSEQARFQKKPVIDAVLKHVHDLKIAARCIVTRGIAGCYENGEVTTHAQEILSYNLPVRIYIVLPAAETERTLAALDPMITDGLMVMHDLQVVSHRVSNALLPKQLKVRDVMTPSPRRVQTHDPVSEAARLLLSSIFTGLPVVDPANRPVGVITQGDLISRGGLPLRLGLLAESDQERMNAILDKLAHRPAREVMTSPAKTVVAEQYLGEAVNMMLTKGLKRLPVVDEDGVLIGMLSRLDIFKAIMREAPDWHAFKAQEVEVADVRYVGDIVRRDARTVSPETPLAEIFRMIDQDDIQRITVVDDQGILLGLISDRDLLVYFKQAQQGIWGLLAKVKQAVQHDAGSDGGIQSIMETKAEDVMRTDLITVTEHDMIETAIQVMTEKSLKRLPVVDGTGRFKGLISRDSLLRTGLGRLS